MAEQANDENKPRRGCLGRVGLLLAWLAGAYGVGLTGFLLLRALVGADWLPIAVFNSFAHLLLWGALLLAILALGVWVWRRRRATAWVLLMLLPGALVCLITYAPFFLPKTINVPPDAPTFTLLTYNTHNESVFVEPLGRVIRAADADIVALQELSDEAALHLGIALADEYPYRALHARTDWHALGVLSRYPILDDTFGRVRLGYQRVVLDVAGEPLALTNVHTSHPFGATEGRFFDPTERARELGNILRWATRDGQPGRVLLAGDFNSTDQTAIYGQFAAQFTDSYRAAGWGMGFTFPDLSAPNAVPDVLWPRTFPWLPLLARLDYVWHGERLRALEAHVWPEAGGSDHRPLWVRLAVIPAD